MSYRHILLPTDGSPASAEAIVKGVDLARALGATVTGLMVIADAPVVAGYGDPQLVQDAPVAEANSVLAEVTAAAERAGVAHDAFYVRAISPADAIVRIAEERGCDLIVMASHGHTGLARLFLGSVTADVLQRTKIPVLVHR